MKPTSLRKNLLLSGTSLVVLVGTLAPSFSASADPVSDLRSWSVLKDADLSKLSGGNVSAAGGPISRLARGMSVQSAYVVRAPVKTTVGLIEQWNPTRHSDLHIYLQGDLPSRVSPDNFRNLASAPSNSSVRAFVEATQRLPGDTSKLQLSSAEAKQYAGGTSAGGNIPGPMVAFWSQILAERVKSFVSGGLGGQPPYEAAGVSPGTEVAQLIDNSGDVRSRFSPVISSSPAGGGRGSLSPSLSWQLFDADGQAAVSLDAFYAKPVGDGYQTLDLGYYSSGGYYAVVTLQQLWPVQVDGQDATLVWRVDLVSSGAFGELRGAERLGSGAAMMRDIQKNIRAFAKDATGGR